MGVVLQSLCSSFLKLLSISCICRISALTEQQREPEVQSQSTGMKLDSLAKLKRRKEGGGKRKRIATQNYLLKQRAEHLFQIAETQMVLLCCCNSSPFFQDRNVQQQRLFPPSERGKNSLKYLFQIYQISDLFNKGITFDCLHLFSFTC